MSAKFVQPHSLQRSRDRIQPKPSDFINHPLKTKEIGMIVHLVNNVEKQLEVLRDKKRGSDLCREPNLQPLSATINGTTDS